MLNAVAHVHARKSCQTFTLESPSPRTSARRPSSPVCLLLQALRRSAHAMESLLLTVQAEVPDTAATLRLSGVELADTIQELGSLGYVWRVGARGGVDRAA